MACLMLSIIMRAALGNSVLVIASFTVGTYIAICCCSRLCRALLCIADGIGQGSPLEMCYYLGKLQEENYLLSKAPKKKGEVDIMIKVPMLG